MGSSGVGKTCILNRFRTDKFDEIYTPGTTIGFDNFIYHVKYKNQGYKLFFYDTAGQEKYNSLKGINCIIFVFDLSNSQSFKDLDMW